MSLLRPLGYISLYFKPFSNISAIFVYYHWFYDILDYIIPAISQAFFSRPFFCLEFSRIFNPELNEPDRAATWSKLGNNDCSEHDWVSTVLSWQKFEHYHWACFSLMCVWLLTYYITHYAKQCCEGHFYQGCTYLAALLNTHIYIRIIPFLAVLYDYLSQLNYTILSCIISFDYLL